jgi:hypothetical protein
MFERFDLFAKRRSAAVCWIPNNTYVDGQDCSKLLVLNADGRLYANVLKLPMVEFAACEKATAISAPGIVQEDENGDAWYPRGIATAMWADSEEKLEEAKQLFEQRLSRAKDLSEKSAAGELDQFQELERPVFVKARVAFVEATRLSFAAEDVIAGKGRIVQIEQ